MSRRLPPREATHANVQHPDLMPNGSTAWRIGMNLHDLADKIQNGSPVDGWEGDARLTLASYRDPKTGEQRWELWRLENDNEYRLVAWLPQDRDPSGIIRRLVEMDARRGFDIHEAVSRHNAQVDRERQYQSDQVVGAASERLAHSLRKAAGIKDQF